MRVFTYFDSNLWDLHNKGWRKLGSIDAVALMSPDLDADDRREIERLFPSCHLIDTSFYDMCNFILSQVKDGQEYLFTSPANYPPFEFPTNKDAFCRSKEDASLDLKMQLSEPITSLLNKVDLIKSTEVVLDSSLIFGTTDFWVAFVGFQNYLKQAGYFTNTVNAKYGDLVLSLFYRNSSSFSTEIQK